MNMIRAFCLSLFASLSLWSFAYGQSPSLEQATVGLIPYPQEVKLSKGLYRLPQRLRLVLEAEGQDWAFVKKTLEELLRSYPEHQVAWGRVGERSEVLMRYDASIVGREAYSLTISPRGITIKASHRQGMLYGLMTLAQLLDSHYDRRLERFMPLECLTINDSPRYALRALMLDPARHFLPKEAIKRYIDQMLCYKLNTLQLHLTDDQGWRIAIEKHPHLTAVNSTRPRSRWATRSGEDKRRKEEGYYTQSDMRELIAYANERGIELIPEIDIPGHTAALLAAYPELRMEAHRDSTFVVGAVDNVMLSATSERSYEVLGDIFEELSRLFPRGTRLHLGGDESAIARNWALSPSHQQLMRAEGYDKAEDLMGYFFGRVYRLLAPYGFRPMQWCELDNIRLPANRYLMPYPQDVTLVTWRMGLTPKCIKLTRSSGHQLILAPGESAYLDYPQWYNDLPEYNNWGMPMTSLEQSYNFDLRSGISEQDDRHIIGVMATLWGEAIPDIERAMYMTYPRALAIAEQGWTRHHQRSWQRFKRFVPYALDRLERQGVAHRRPVELYESP